MAVSAMCLASGANFASEEITDVYRLIELGSLLTMGLSVNVSVQKILA